MSITKTLQQRRQRRTWRVRNQVRRAASGRLRLSVFRSNKHISAQVIDDASGKTVASASSAEKELREQLKNGGNVASVVRNRESPRSCLIAANTDITGESRRWPMVLAERVCSFSRVNREGNRGREFRTS
jgi:hypothetical protein